MVDTSRDVLPEWGAGVLDDPRLDLHYTDAHAFLRDNEGMYDVIIMDIADPIEAGPGYILYTQVCLLCVFREGDQPAPLSFARRKAGTDEELVRHTAHTRAKFLCIPEC